jgi:hypothetical protein
LGYLTDEATHRFVDVCPNALPASVRVAFTDCINAAGWPGRLIDLLLAGWQKQLRSSGSTIISIDVGADVTLRRITKYFFHHCATLAK